jgi:hypothetical protein
MKLVRPEMSLEAALALPLSERGRVAPAEPDAVWCAAAVAYMESVGLVRAPEEFPFRAAYYSIPSCGVCLVETPEAIAEDAEWEATKHIPKRIRVKPGTRRG